jgi:hypothetical protein
MSKNNSSATINSLGNNVRQQEKNKPEIVELSFESMETISGGCCKVCWCSHEA